MSKEEELLECWQDLTADQQEEALNFLKALKQKTVIELINPLGQRLRSIRQRILASGTPLLTWDELETEVSARRGGEATREV
ncbi:MAG: hypothetical protein LH647_06475 [Leptolyngbyaceae cyanobacterium CAN_BIN12]|nr:hypothetical protein [Leptolyngbyaceae cyanobacterium CAN_BIN12]